MQENQSGGIEATVAAVAEHTQIAERPRGQNGKFAGKKQSPAASDQARNGGEEPELGGPEREIEKKTLSKKEQRDAFDEVRQRYSADKKAEKAPKAQPASKEAESAQESEEHSEANSERQGGKPRASDAEIALAKAAMIRSGFRPKEVESMPVDELLKRAALRQKALDDADRAFDFVRSHKAKPSKDTADGVTESAQAAPVPTIDPEAIKSLAKTLGLEESEAKGLEAAMTALVQPLVERLERQEHQLQGHAATTQEAIVDAARQQLRESFPELDDPDRYAEVEETMTALSVLPKYKTGGTMQVRIARLMRDAAIAAQLEQAPSGEVARQVDSDRQIRKEKRANGRPTSDVRSTPKPISRAEQDRIVFDRLRGGDDIRSARVIAGLS